MDKRIESNQLYITVTPEQAKTRLDSLISSCLSGYSRSFAQKLIELNLVSVNGVIVSKSSTPVKTADTIIITIPNRPQHDITTITDQFPTIHIVHEHNDFFIINKPAGLLVHQPFKGSTQVTLVDWLLATHPDLATIGPCERPGIIHRLDKNTSGLLVIPRTHRAYTLFGDMFRSRTIAKTYQAIVQGHTPESGTVDLYVGRDPRNPTRMAGFDHETAHRYIRNGHKLRHAITHYRAIEYYDNQTLIEIKPITGRTHQIRVHLSAIGHPILNDAIYGTVCHELLNRQALHATSLDFSFDGTPFAFSCPLSRDITDTTMALKNFSR